MHFAIFPVRVFKASPATKKGGQVIQSAAPVTQNHLSKLEDLMLQNATPLRKSAPWPPNISTSKSGPRPSVLNLTSKCASRHNGMHFSLSQLLKVLQVFIWPDVSAPAALAGLLFDPPEPRIIRKTQWIATFLPSRAPASSFFWLFLFSDLLSSDLLFADSYHLCFSICPNILGSLTSKLPSISSYV